MRYSRAIIDAINNRELENEEAGFYLFDPQLKLEIPRKVNGVPAEILNPRDSWKDKVTDDHSRMAMKEV